MRATEFITESWSQKYKKSINCSHPKGFSQRAHCAGKNKNNESVEMEMVCEDCGMCETHGDPMMEVKQRLDAKCWKGKHKEGTKIKGGIRVNNCVPNESVEDKKPKYTYPEIKSPKHYDPNWIKDLPKEKLDAIAGPRYKKDKKEQGVVEDLSEEFDLIENIIEGIAALNGVDAETVWADLESLTEDELYAFAVTSQLNEDWQKANKRDKTDGMSQKAVNAYRRENPGSKLKTAVTTKPSKLKKGGKASKRRKSYCSRSRGQMKMHSISCAKTPDKAICKARRRWNC